MYKKEIELFYARGKLIGKIRPFVIFNLEKRQRGKRDEEKSRLINTHTVAYDLEVGIRAKIRQKSCYSNAAACIPLNFVKRRRPEHTRWWHLRGLVNFQDAGCDISKITGR